MESLASETSTLAAREEKKQHAPSTHSSQNGEAPDPSTLLPPTHDSNFGDPSFPFQSTNIEEGGFTDEYRIVSKTGLIPANTALRPIPSHQSVTPPALRDPEKARELKDVKLVTFVDNDPQDPRNWSRLFRWCMYNLSFCRSLLSLNTHLLSDITFVCALSVVEVAFASAVVTGDFQDIQAKYRVGDVVAGLSVSLMVAGFGLGPLFWSPVVSQTTVHVCDVPLLIIV